MSQQYRWLWVSSFLEFPALTSNWVTNRSWTGTSAQSSLWVSLSQLIFAAALCESYYPHLNFQGPWRAVGFPTLRAHTHRVAELESIANQCPEEPVFVPDSSLCFSLCACVILTTCAGRTVWFRPSDADLLKYTFFNLQTSFIHTHPVLLSWW